MRKHSSGGSNLFFLLCFDGGGSGFGFNVLRNLLFGILRSDENDFFSREVNSASLHFSVLASPGTEQEDGEHEEHADKDTDSATEDERHGSAFPRTELVQCTVKSHRE